MSQSGRTFLKKENRKEKGNNDISPKYLAMKQVARRFCQQNGSYITVPISETFTRSAGTSTSRNESENSSNFAVTCIFQQKCLPLLPGLELPAAYDWAVRLYSNMYRGAQVSMTSLLCTTVYGERQYGPPEPRSSLSNRMSSRRRSSLETHSVRQDHTPSARSPNATVCRVTFRARILYLIPAPNTNTMEIRAFSASLC